MNERLKALADAGVSIWLDDLSRERITSGNLADLVSNFSVTGVTTNPTIFATALLRVTCTTIRSRNSRRATQTSTTPSRC